MQLLLNARKDGVRRNDIAAGRVLDGLPRRDRALHDLVHGCAVLIFGSYRHRQVALRVAVDRQHAEALLFQTGRQNAGRCGFRHAAFLVGQCKYRRHVLHLFQLYKVITV